MATERPLRHFQEELEALQSRLLEMGGLAEERVRHSVQGLADRDFGLIEAVLAGGLWRLARANPRLSRKKRSRRP